jgi:hypothetical protein
LSLYPTKSNIRMFIGWNSNNAYLRFIRNFLGWNLDGLALLRLSCNLLASRIFLYSLLLSKTKTDFISDQTSLSFLFKNKSLIK